MYKTFKLLLLLILIFGSTQAADISVTHVGWPEDMCYNTGDRVDVFVTIDNPTSRQVLGEIIFAIAPEISQGSADGKQERKKFSVSANSDVSYHLGIFMPESFPYRDCLAQVSVVSYKSNGMIYHKIKHNALSKCD